MGLLDLLGYEFQITHQRPLGGGASAGNDASHDLDDNENATMTCVCLDGI